MKKIILSFALLTTTCGLFAQKFYVDVNAGYGFGFPKSILGQDTKINVVNSMSVSGETKNIEGSLGKGLNLQLTPGYKFNKYIGLELGISFFAGSKVLANQTIWSNVDTTWNIDADKFSTFQSYAKVTQLRLTPTVVFSTDTIKGLSGYAKLGMIIPVYGVGKANSIDRRQILNTNNGEITKYIEEKAYTFNGQVSIGFRGAIGAEYRISDHISVFGEMFVSSLSIKHSKRTTTKWNFDGEDQMGGKSKYVLETEFVEKLDDKTNNPQYNPNVSADLPRQELSQKTNLTQMGISIGFKYTF